MAALPHLRIYEEAATVRQTLARAGFEPGQRVRIARSGDLKAEFRPGPVVAVRRIWDVPGRVWWDLDQRIYVDHAGPGGKEAMARYRQALVDAGYQVTTGKLSHYARKEFLWIRP